VNSYWTRILISASDVARLAATGLPRSAPVFSLRVEEAQPAHSRRGQRSRAR
jgi:hypothetical protein